jgi:type I restriction enzyme S subunit
MIRVNDLRETYVPLKNLMKVNPDIENNYVRSRICDGDLLISVIGSIGLVSIVPKFTGIVNISRNIARISPIEQCSVEYLLYLLKNEKIGFEIIKNSKGGNQQQLSLSKLREIKIPLPPLSLQQQFAHIVESVERIREQQVASGRQIEGLCEGLMQRAFAGELMAKSS